MSTRAGSENIHIATIIHTLVNSAVASEPGFLETSPVVVFKFVAPVFLLLPLVWLGLEWTAVVSYSPRS